MASARRRRIFRRKDENMRPGVSPKEEGIVLSAAHSIFCPRVFRDDDTIFAKSQSGVLGLFSLRTGECRRAYENIKYVSSLAILNDDIFAFVRFRSSIVGISRISDGHELDSFECEQRVSCLLSIGYGRFLVSLEDGVVIEMQWSQAGRLMDNRRIQAVHASNWPKDISVCGDRFAVCSTYSDEVVVFDLPGFTRVAVVKVPKPRCIDLSDPALVTGCVDGRIFVFNTDKFDAVREIHTHSEAVHSVQVLLGGRYLLSTGGNGLICIQDIEAGAPIWQRLFNTEVSLATVLPEGRLVTWFASGSINVQKIPSDIAELVIPRPTPLRDAFKGCISGEGKASEKCKELITFDNCHTSFDEWCCAHQLLMMALEDGDIPKSRDYNGEIGWWFKNLYLAAKDIPKGSDDDVRTVERFLLQAKRIGVVEGAEPVLAAIRVTKDLKAEVRALQRADILLLERVLSIEARLELLKESFDRYRKRARTSQLIGVALQIIPIAGGSVASIVSAGVEIIEELSVKDMTDYFLGLGSSLLLDEVSSMSDRVFNSAAAALSPEQLETMNVEHRRRLEQVVESQGLSTASLRELFLERAQHARLVGRGESGTFGNDGALDAVEVVIEEVENESNLGLLERRIDEEVGASNSRTGTETTDNAVLSTNAGRGTSDKLPLQRPSSWKSFRLDTDSVRLLSQEQMSALWAAYVVRNDDTRQDEYDVLRKSLVSLFEEERLFSELIIDSAAIPSEKLIQCVLESMSGDGVRMTMGVEGKIRQFLSEIRGEV